MLKKNELSIEEGQDLQGRISGVGRLSKKRQTSAKNGEGGRRREV